MDTSLLSNFSLDELVNQLICIWMNDYDQDEIDSTELDDESSSDEVKNERKERIEHQEKLWNEWFPLVSYPSPLSIVHQHYPELHDAWIHDLVWNNMDISNIEQTRDEWFELTYYAVICRRQHTLEQMWQLNPTLCRTFWNSWSVFNFHTSKMTQDKCWGDFDCLPMLILTTPPCEFEAGKPKGKTEYEASTLSILQFFYTRITTFASYFDIVKEDSCQTPPSWLSPETKEMWPLILNMTVQTINKIDK